MIDDEQLIAKLKSLDSQQCSSTAAIEPEPVVRQIMQVRSHRQANRRRMQILVAGLAGFGLVAALATWYAEREPAGTLSIQSPQNRDWPEQQLPSPATTAPDISDSQIVASESTVDGPGAPLDSKLSSELNSELNSELEHWRSTHAQLQQQVFELDRTLLREELSRNSSAFDFEMTSSLFF